MKVLAVALLIIGAVINYLSKIIYKLFSKKEAQDEENVRVKLIGVVIFLVGLILTVVITPITFPVVVIFPKPDTFPLIIFPCNSMFVPCFMVVPPMNKWR